jgi:NAD(P)H-dependent flavin oxidoreductase YrpB (nitropropane dioxygenase family)
MTTPVYPKIIQGGMGMFVSGPKLARAVAMSGEQGTLSGVCLEKALARKLQTGDPGGHLRRALAQ